MECKNNHFILLLQISTPKKWAFVHFFGARLLFYHISLLPHVALFLGHGGDFVGYLLRGELDVVHESLLRLVAADVHHLKDGVSVAQIHIGDTGASGYVTCYTLLAWHNHITVKVGFRLFLLFFQRLLLLHGELGRHFFFQRRQLFRQIFQNILDVTVKHLLVGFRYVVAVFLTDCDKVSLRMGIVTSVLVFFWTRRIMRGPLRVVSKLSALRLL